MSVIGMALALLLAQTTPSRDEVAGATLALRVAAAQIGQRVITIPQANLACVAPAVSIPGNAVTIRVGVVILSVAGQRALGWTTAADGTDLAETYAAMEIQAAPSTSQIVRPPEAIDYLEDTEVEKRVTPLFSTCEIAIARQGFATMPWRCACAEVPATCVWTGGTPPKNLTLAPGAWSGAGCRRKPCVERFGTSSMSAECL